MKLEFPDELSDFDLLLFKGESNPSTRSPMLSVIMLESAPDYDRLRRVIDRVSRSFIRFRQKVVLPNSTLVPARWVIDADFELDYHFRKVGLAAPYDENALLTLSDQINAAPFDVTRPLWELTYVEGLKHPDAKAALIMKIHHAVTDGVGALALMQDLFAVSPDAEEGDMPLLPVPEELSSKDVTRIGSRKAIVDLLPKARANFSAGLSLVKRSIFSPKASLSELMEYGDSVQRVMSNKNLFVSPVMRGRSLARDMAIIEVPLKQIKAATKKAGVTVNDGFLAAVSQALRNYHSHHMVEIEQLSISMPVNMRSADNNEAGNHFTGVRINLPLSVEHPEDCLKDISNQVRTATAEPGLSLFNLITPIIAKIPDSAMQQIGGQFDKPDIQLSNVPGYPKPIYLAGSKVSKLVPFGPVPGVAAMITMFSYNGTCFVGVHSDSAAIKDFELFESCLRDGFDRILGFGASPNESSRKKSVSNKSKAAKKPRAAQKNKPAKKKSSTKKTAPAVKAKKKARRSSKKVKKVSAKKINSSSGE